MADENDYYLANNYTGGAEMADENRAHNPRFCVFDGEIYEQVILRGHEDITGIILADVEVGDIDDLEEVKMSGPRYLLFQGQMYEKQMIDPILAPDDYQRLMKVGVPAMHQAPGAVQQPAVPQMSVIPHQHPAITGKIHGSTEKSMPPSSTPRPGTVKLYYGFDLPDNVRQTMYFQIPVGKCEGNERSGGQVVRFRWTEEQEDYLVFLIDLGMLILGRQIGGPSHYLQITEAFNRRFAGPGWMERGYNSIHTFAVKHKNISGRLGDLQSGGLQRPALVWMQQIAAGVAAPLNPADWDLPWRRGN